MGGQQMFTANDNSGGRKSEINASKILFLVAKTSSMILAHDFTIILHPPTGTSWEKTALRLIRRYPYF
jgi:hypothetical protein